MIESLRAANQDFNQRMVGFNSYNRTIDTSITFFITIAVIHHHKKLNDNYNYNSACKLYVYIKVKHALY